MTAPRQLAELQRTSVAPAPLAHSRPRAVGLTAAGRTLVALAMLLFAVAIGAGLGMYREAQRQEGSRRALVADGVMTTGEVTRLWPSGDNGRRVAYRFEVGEQLYAGDIRVSASRRASLEVGSPLSVRYVPANPRVNDLGGEPRIGLPLWLPSVVATILAAAGVLCLLTLNRQRQLLADGRLAQAVVLKHERHHSSHGTQRSMTFEFPLLSGAVASGKTGTSSKPPAVGSVIWVVYDPDQPSRNMVYPPALVRPVQ
jgi:hypothetical protein